MRRWFLSYNSQDLALMQAFEEALRRKDAAAQIFFAPNSLRAGGYWLKQLADEIAKATALVLLIGQKGLGRWQFDEYCEARDRRVPVVLVLLEGQAAPGLPMLRQLHWIVTSEPTSEQTVARVIASTESDPTQPQELWRYTAPYRGLAAMTESDVDFFFGRERETVEVVKALVSAERELPILFGNSGVGKSSLAQAGALAALVRQGWPEKIGNSEVWPQVFSDSRRWCFLKLKPGREPIRSLVEPFLRTWHFDPTDPRLETRQAEWIESLAEGRNTLKGLLNATEDRFQELGQPKPPAFLIYIDQGEELYVRAEERQRRRFSSLLAEGLGDSRLNALMSMRSDFLGELQKDEPLYKVRRQIDVPPLREAELREVVSRPAELLSARFETPGLVDIITRRTAEDSVKDVGALPLLSYTLDDMWTEMVKRADGVLRLPTQSFELGGVLVNRADDFLATHPKSQEELRRIFTKLATVREDEEPTRRRALRSEFTEDQWRLVSALADHPYRLLVTVTPESGETYAEVAHEAIFRRWGKLRGWIALEREFLAWRTGLQATRRAWEATPDNSKNGALLMGRPLALSQSWLADHPADIPKPDRDFIGLSRKVSRRQRLRHQAAGCAVIAALVLGVSAWWYEQELRARLYWLTGVHGYVHTAAMIRSLKPRESWKDCAECPEMILVPAGKFMMGEPGEKVVHRPQTPAARAPKEVLALGKTFAEMAASLTDTIENQTRPQHLVEIAEPFAVARFELTFSEWAACVTHGGDCDPHISAKNRGPREPVISVTLVDARRYVTWLSSVTGQPYRLLSEAEWEYAARAGTTTAYSWGDDFKKQGNAMANCKGCGSQYDGQPAPVGSFAPNAFGLYDMEGNVQELVEDCFHWSYDGAPADGSAWGAGTCLTPVVRGGSYNTDPKALRLFSRSSLFGDMRFDGVGFRVGRAVGP
jgi:formylglycine-generating enzyme required for sulfatase activity